MHAQAHSQYPVAPTAFVYQDKFDPAAQIFQCCGQCMHVKTGTILIAVVETIIAIARMIMLWSMNNGILTTMQIVEVILTVLWLAIIGCLLYGMYLENADYLMPYLITQVVVVTMMFVGAFISFVLLVTGGQSLSILIGDEAAAYINGDYSCEKRGKILGWLLMVYLLIGELLVWFFVVVLACYRYLREKDRAINKAYAQNVVQAGAPQGYYQQAPPAQAYGAMPLR